MSDSTTPTTTPRLSLTDKQQNDAQRQALAKPFALHAAQLLHANKRAVVPRLLHRKSRRDPFCRLIARRADGLLVALLVALHRSLWSLLPEREAHVKQRKSAAKRSDAAALSPSSQRPLPRRARRRACRDLVTIDQEKKNLASTNRQRASPAASPLDARLSSGSPAPPKQTSDCYGTMAAW
jgi:hypothetical protein